MSTEENRQEKRFTETAAEMLRQSAEELDAATLSRLNQARQKALAELPGHDSATHRAWWWAPAGAVAAAAVVAVVLWQGRVPEPAFDLETVPTMADDTVDFELLLDEESLEMMEDLEFFAWLSEADLSPEAEATG